MGSLFIVKLYPVAQHSIGMLQTLKAVTVNALFFNGANQPFHHTVLLWAMRCDEFLLQTITAHQCGIFPTGEYKPLSEHNKKRSGTLPKQPKRLIKACSKERTAVLALPVLDSCQPNNSRVWQSITKAKLSQPSLPPQTRHKSVDQR